MSARLSHSGHIGTAASKWLDAVRVSHKREVYLHRGPAGVVTADCISRAPRQEAPPASTVHAVCEQTRVLSAVNCCVLSIREVNIIFVTSQRADVQNCVLKLRLPEKNGKREGGEKTSG